MRLLVTTAVAALIMAGCSGPHTMSVAPAAWPSTSTGPVGWNDTFEFTGRIHGGAHPGPYLFMDGVESAIIAWPGAVGIDARLEWTSPGSMTDLDLFLFSPVWHATCSQSVRPECIEAFLMGSPGVGVFANRGGNTGAPDTPALVGLDAAALRGHTCSAPPCDWMVAAYVDGAAALTEFRLVVSVEYAP